MGEYGPPRIGEPRLNQISTDCAYALAPGYPMCSAPGTSHGIVTSDPPGERRPVFTCDEHLPIVRAFADYVHEIEPACELLDAWFYADLNRCALPGDWDVAARTLQVPPHEA